MRANVLSLFIAIPAYEGVRATCFSALNNLQEELRARRVETSIGVVSNNSLIPDARNRLLAAFLASGRSHALLLDSDVAFNSKTVFDMLQKGRDFVVGAVPLRGVQWELVDDALREGLFPVKNYACRYNIQFADPSHILSGGDGLVEVALAGVAFAVISRTAVERMVAHYPDLLYDTDGITIPGLFQPIIEDRKLIGEDIAFCRRWRDIGGQIWLMPNAPLCHTGPATFEGNFANTLTVRRSEDEHPSLA